MVELRDLAPGDAGWLVMRHGALYAAEYGFDASFEALVADILADFLRRETTDVDRGWIAHQGDTRLGSIFCVRHSETVAKLRLFFVEPSARKQGLGQRLMDVCLDHARAQGFIRMELLTHAEHAAACALYTRNGFRRVSSTPVINFSVPMTEETWGRAL